MRRAPLPLPLLLLASLTLPACHRAPPGQVLVLTKDDTTGQFVPRVLTVGAKGPGVALPGDLNDALPYGDGSHVLGTHPEGDKARLVRVTPSKGAVERLDATLTATDKLIAVSDDGQHVLVRFNPTSEAAGGARLIDLKTGKTVEQKMRLFASGAVSPDGREALVSGIPVDCSATSMNDCPFPMWRLSIDGTAKLARGGTDVVANYHPYYLPDGRVALQTTARSGCKGTNGCRHDIVVVPANNSRGAGDGPARRRLRPGLLSVGGLLAYLVYDAPDTHCTKLPCDTADLFVAPAGASAGAARLLARAQVSMFNPNAFSSDGKYLVYGSKTDLFVCSVDDAHCDKLGTGWFAGWVR